MVPIIALAWKSSSVYLFWVGMHYFSSHAYPYFCADLSFSGMVTSPFMVITPHCKALHWVQKTSTLAIENMWIVLGSWLATQLLPNPALIIGVGSTPSPQIETVSQSTQVV